MRLNTVHIQHYKSLHDVVVDFDPGVTVLVGPNAAGKSNFADALCFARDAIKEGLDHAISQRGGITRIRQWSKTRPYKLSLTFYFDQGIDEVPMGSKYEFSVKPLADGNYEVDSEACEWIARDSVQVGGPRADEFVERQSHHFFRRDNEGRVVRDGKNESKPVPRDQLLIGKSPDIFDPDNGFALSNFISEWRFATLHPNKLKDLSIPVQDRKLKEDGSNWASVLRAMKKTAEGKASLEKIREAMQVVVPTFRDVSVTSVGSYLVPWFTFDSNGETVKFDPGQLSDGTLRVFGILLALYQNPPPSLLVIEEPEQTVHPGVLAVLADAFREAAERMQIIVTSHSPHLVDCFEPHQLRVVTLENGLTQIRSLRRTQVEAVKRKLMSLEELMLAEGLQPEV